VGAEKGERTAGRQSYRSGYYGRTLITRVGKLELRVPQDRAARFSTELFERYQRSERALVTALAEMYVQGSAFSNSKEDPSGGSGVAISFPALANRKSAACRSAQSLKVESEFYARLLAASLWRRRRA
jgi:putative transposase